MSALDTQIGGDHYKDMPIQPMEFSMANGLDACQHTIIKYVTRFRDKGGVQDLEKAKHVIDMLIEFESEGKEGKSEGAKDLDEFVYDFSNKEDTPTEEELGGCGCPACTLRTSLGDLFGGAGIQVVVVAKPTDD